MSKKQLDKKVKNVASKLVASEIKTMLLWYLFLLKDSDIAIKTHYATSLLNSFVNA